MVLVRGSGFVVQVLWFVKNDTRVFRCDPTNAPLVGLHLNHCV